MSAGEDVPVLRTGSKTGVSGRSGKSGRRYAAAYRERIVGLARSGRTPEELSREFEPSARTIRNWVAQADRDEGRRPDGSTRKERREIRDLRRQIRVVEEEIAILKRAEAWFAREIESDSPDS